MSAGRRLFVTGTDTEVGKSVVTACLAASARGRGTVRAVKPVASGVPARERGEDATLLGFAAGHAPIVWGTWQTPVSPHRAAMLEGLPVPHDLLDRIRGVRADTVLVEGVGGWRVPLCLEPALWVSDLARATAGPVLVVAANRLGVLNHTLLTVEAVRAEGLQVAAVVLNEGAPAASDDRSRAWNHADLQALLDVPVHRIPRVDPGDAGSLRRAGDALWDVVAW
jgi:dethiobiotin synthetase